MANVMIHVGLGDYVSSVHSIAVIQPGSITGRRRVSAARRINQYIDCSHGKGIRSYVLLDDNTVVASHLSTRALAKRYSCEISDGGDAETNAASQSPQCSYIVHGDDVENDDLPFSDIGVDDFDGDIEVDGDIYDDEQEDNEEIEDDWASDEE